MGSELLGIVAIKACAAGLLGLAAAFAGRWCRRPAVLHVLWVVVLLELLIPPVLEVGVIPRIGATDSPTAIDAGVEPAGFSPAVAGTPDSDFTGVGQRSWVSPASTLGTLWAAGALGMLLLTAVRMRRFARLLGSARAAPTELRAEAIRLARRLGLVRCPRIRLVPAGISPMLRPRLGSLEVLFPSTLLESLSRGEREALLAHELAHVRRGDYRIRLIELAAGVLFWWHPVVWWARREIRRVEEQCCDALVVEALPDRANDYAKGLLKTVEFLAGQRAGVPCLASGAGGAEILKERLTMIVERRSEKLSILQRFVLALAAGTLLLVMPTWADRGADPANAEPDSRIARSEAEIHEDMLALESQAQALELELREIRQHQRDLESDLHRQRGESELDRLEAEAERLDAAGHADRAEELRREQDLMREELALAVDRELIERRHSQEMLELEAPMRNARIEADRAAARGNREKAADLERHAYEMQLHAERLGHEARRRHEFVEQRATELEMDRLREQIEAHESRGQHEEALAREMELEKASQDAALAARHRAHQNQIRELQIEIETLSREFERLHRAGELESAAELERKMESIREMLDERAARDY